MIALSDGILRRLSLEELAGVLPHELSHIRNRDLRVLGFADLRERPDYAELLPPIRLESWDHPRSLVRSRPLPPRWLIGGYR